MPVARLRDRRGGQDQVAVQVLTTAREQLNAERLRAINALTALVRTHDLSVDARRALPRTQIRQINLASAARTRGSRDRTHRSRSAGRKGRSARGT